MKQKETPRFIFLSSEKSSADSAVTAHYRNIVCKAARNAGFLCLTATRNTRFSKTDFVFADTVIDAICAYIHGAERLVFWAQGILPEESYLRNRSHIRKDVLSVLERFVLKKSKALFLVSEEMLRFYEKKYRLSLREKSFYMPCFNETAVYAEAFFEEKYKEQRFAYVGSLNAWQCFEETAKLYARIEEKLGGNTKFYVFTFQTEEALALLSRLHIKNYEVESLEREALARRLSEMKYGFVLRKENWVNRVATPTKFSSYLACGVIPIYSSVLCDFARIDQKEKIGIVYDFSDEDSGFSEIRSHVEKEISAKEMKEKCERVFSGYYHTETYQKEICAFLAKL